MGDGREGFETDEGIVNRQATLHHVAERANVHPSTASRALNAKTRSMVREETVERVLAAAVELGYQPNALARGLKINQTMTIGMLIPDLNNPLFPPIVRGIEDRANEDGFSLLLGNTDNDLAKERNLLEVMMRRRVDGLLLATAKRSHPLLSELLERDFPVVLVNRTADEPPLSSVAGDDQAGIRLAVKHLVDQGHRRIAHLAGTSSVSTGVNRRQSFQTSMESLGCEVDPQLVVTCEWFREEDGEVAFEELVARSVPFTAIVAANDMIALGCYRAARRHGIRIPEDISVVGYNDTRFADAFCPPLTTVRLPLYEIGRKAAELLLMGILSPNQATVSMRLTPSLVVRASTGPAS
jgi:LacI family transcriptional regulator